MNNPIKVCIITGARSEYGLLYWLIHELEQDPKIQCQLVVTGMHLSEKFGHTIDIIKNDGWNISASVDLEIDNDSSNALSYSVARGVAGFTDVFSQISPDLILVMGDRYELLSIAPVAVMMGIPIAHISGGEVTEGAIDDQIRHAMTKFSSLHFTANEEFSQRVRQMGEESWRIFTVGEPGLDFITRIKPTAKKELSDDIGLDLDKKTALVTVHTTTHELGAIDKQMQTLIQAMNEFDCQYLITYPNADPGHDIIINHWQKFERKNPSSVVLIKNLGQQRYISSLHYIDLMIGNTSSGLVESPSFGLPVVNVGNRQKGRIMADNVVCANFEYDELKKAIQKAFSTPRLDIENPYGNGKSSRKIVDAIISVFKKHSKEEVLTKKFVDM